MVNVIESRHIYSVPMDNNTITYLPSLGGVLAEVLGVLVLLLLLVGDAVLEVLIVGDGVVL